jgi:hypothetical protein
VKSSDNSALGGSWLTVDASGNVKVQKGTKDTQSVKLKYTQNGVDAFTNAFTVTV